MASPNEFPNLFAARTGVNYRFTIRCRGLALSCRPLSILEENAVISEVVDEMHALDPIKQTQMLQSSLMAIKKLELAQTDDVGSKSGIKCHAIELQRLTAGELDKLFKDYVAECEKCSPTFESIPAEELEAFVDSLKKNTSERESMLTEASFFKLVSTCRHLLTIYGSPMVS